MPTSELSKFCHNIVFFFLCGRTSRGGRGERIGRQRVGGKRIESKRVGSEGIGSKRVGGKRAGAKGAGAKKVGLLLRRRRASWRRRCRHEDRR